MSNKGILKAWNTVLYDKFMKWQDFIPIVMEHHFAANYEKNKPQEGWHIGDLGSGLGNSTFDLACNAPESCKVTGIDCSPKFVEFAKTEEPKKHGDKMQKMLDSGRLNFIVKDVENDDLLESPNGRLPAFDALYAVDGTQFYIMPVKAFKQIHKALKPNGKLHFTVFRKREACPSLYIAQQTAEKFIAEEDKKPHDDALTCGPGPFSQVWPDVLSDQLTIAGFTDITFARFDSPMIIGRDIEEALLFTTSMGPAGEAIRLVEEKSGDAAKEKREQIMAELRKTYANHVEHRLNIHGEMVKGVYLPSSTWTVSATKPADDA